MAVSVNAETAALAWVVGAFEYILEHDQTRLVPYMIDLSEDLAFESEMDERRTNARGGV